MILYYVDSPRGESDAEGEDQREWFATKVEAMKHFRKVRDACREAVRSGPCCIEQVVVVGKVDVPSSREGFVWFFNSGLWHGVETIEEWCETEEDRKVGEHAGHGMDGEYSESCEGCLATAKKEGLL